MKLQQSITIYEAGDTKIPIYMKIEIHEDINRSYKPADKYTIYFYVQNTEELLFELLFNDAVQNELVKKIYNLYGILISERIKPKAYALIKDCKTGWEWYFGDYGNGLIFGQVVYKGYDIFDAIDGLKIDSSGIFVAEKELTLNKINLTYISTARIENGAGKLSDEQSVLTVLKIAPNEKLINKKDYQQIELEYIAFFKIQELL